MKLNHIMIGVKDLDEAMEFYRKIFNYSVLEPFIDSRSGFKGMVLSEKERILHLSLCLFRCLGYQARSSPP